MTKAHLISDFLKKISLGGARTHEKEQKFDEMKIWRAGILPKGFFCWYNFSLRPFSLH